jgi:hypothetical protein
MMILMRRNLLESINTCSGFCYSSVVVGYRFFDYFANPGLLIAIQAGGESRI